MNRRTFVETAAGVLAASPAGAIPLEGGLPTRAFGKTGRQFPILAFGGAAFIKATAPAFNVPVLSQEEGVQLVRHAYEKGVRYFDTARGYQESEERIGEALHGVRDKVYLATKVQIDFGSAPFDIARMQSDVDTSLAKLQTDHVDCIQVHMPVDYDRAMQAHDALEALRKQGKLRYIGVTNHANFDVTYRLVATGGFDQVMLAYGYFNGALGKVFTDRSREYRSLTIAKAHELGMGILAMKVMGASVMGHNAVKRVPDYAREELARLPAAAIRWVLSDDRIQILNVGTSLQSDIDQNIATLCGSRQLTDSDRALLADFTRRVYESEAGKKMTPA